MLTPAAGTISVRGLEVFYRSRRGDVAALVGTDLEVAAGRFTTVIGPSGCGKSTLLRVVAGLIRPDAGSVSVGGRSPQETRAAKQIGFVPQAPALLPWRSVMDNVRLPLQVNRRPSPATAISPELALERLGLSAVADKRPHELSGGMAQRVAIARAFVFGPPVLVMDEPFSALDELTREAARQVLLDVWDAAPRTVLWVTHSVSEAVLLGDQVAVMTAAPGRVAATVAVDLPRPRSPDVEMTTAGIHLVATIRSHLRQGAHA